MKHTVYIHARISPYMSDAHAVEYKAFSQDMTAMGWGRVIAVRDIEIPEIPRAELVPSAVQALQAEIDRLTHTMEI